MKGQTKLNPEQRQLVLQHVGLAKRLARQFYRERRRGDLDYEDFEAAALLGLCDAASRFDPQLGQNFPVYGMLRIRGAMIDLLRSIGSLPRMFFTRPAEGEEQEESPASEDRESSREEPSPAPEPAMLVAYTQSELAGIVNSASGLNLLLHCAPQGEELQLSYARALSPEEVVIRADGCRHIERLIEQLPEKERSAVRQYYYEGPAPTDGPEPVFTKSWISRLHQKGLRRLKKSLQIDPRLRRSLRECHLT